MVNTMFSTGLVVLSVSWLGQLTVNATFSTGLVDLSASWLGQLTVNCPSQETERTTRPVENVVLTTKGLQERKHNL